MPDNNDANDFLFGGGAKAFSFENIGDKVTGEIKEMKKQQQTDMTTGELSFWDKTGEPKMMLRIELQTDLQENDDDEGMRSVYLRGGNYTAVKGTGTSSLLAVKDAVRRSGSANGIEIGGILTLEHSGLGQAANKGFNAPKLYTASYRAPIANVDLDDLA
jgi:hypothetical protein